MDGSKRLLPHRERAPTPCRVPQVWGVWLGIADETYGTHWKLLGLGTRSWQNINPELLLTAFLPVLLFAAAFGLEYQYIRRLFTSGLLLAGEPGPPIPLASPPPPARTHSNSKTHSNPLLPSAQRKHAWPPAVP